MRKLDKTNIKATAYQKWQKNLGKNGIKIPQYSSNHKYYKDILADLLIIQNGLCAYTEYRVLDETKVKSLSAKFDAKGQYVGHRPETPTDLEHFDSRIKPVNGWKWDNLFAVFSPINRDVKRVKERTITANKILKPDTTNYSPTKYLDYDLLANIFYPKPGLTAKNKKVVGDMVVLLGINYGFIKMKRTEYITEIVAKKKLGQNITAHQFLTSVSMTLIKLGL